MILRIANTLAVAILFPLATLSQTPKDSSAVDPVASFQPIVKRFQAFFAKPEKLITKEKASSSTTGEVVMLREASGVSEVAYDVQKANSLVSPYLATISLKLVWKETGKCGDVGIKEFGKAFGFSTARKALDSDLPDCYGFPLELDKPRVEPLKFLFSMQESKWVFKDVIIEDLDVPDGDLLSVFGKSTAKQVVTKFDEPEAEAVNSVWRHLLP